jgi:hypothetical protein
MKNSRFLGLIGLLLFVIALNLFILYLPDLWAPGPRSRDVAKKSESSEDVLRKISNIEAKIGDGFSRVFVGEGIEGKARGTGESKGETVQVPGLPGNSPLPARNRGESDPGPAPVPGERGSPSSAEPGPGSPGEGGRLGARLVPDPASYTLVEPPVVLESRSLWDGRKVRYRGHVLELQRDFDPFRVSSGLPIDGETHIRMLVARADCAWNYLPSGNTPLLLKAGLLNRGDAIQVFGRILATQTGCVLLVDDLASDP